LLLEARIARSGRADDVEDEDVLWEAMTLGGSWEVRARDDLRGDIEPTGWMTELLNQ
jgi:hypothetical protein